MFIIFYSVICYMNKILKVSSFFMLVSGQSIFAQQTNAESLSNFENGLVEKYYQKTCSGRAECDQYNEKISNEIESKIKNDSSSFAYSFAKFTEKNMLDIHYSPDRKIKFYTMDVSSGGTMREPYSLIQVKRSNGLASQELAQVGFIDKIAQVKIKNQDVYLVTSLFINSTCSRSYRIHSFVLNNGKFVAKPIFETKTQKLDSIGVENDCQEWERSAEDFIRISKDLKNIDILVVNASGKLTNNYLRYQKTPQGYRYSGVVK